MRHIDLGTTIRCLVSRALVLGTLALGAGAAFADDHPIVIELFTSQGCSSCPPADALLHKLAARDDVIALGLHVDYWDYIGWKDKFAKPSHTARQHAYGRAAGRRSVYTPQMIIQGQDSVVGAHPKNVAALIKAHKAQAAKVDISVRREGGHIVVSAKPANTNGANIGPMVVQLVRYSPNELTKIVRGENAGNTLKYSNVVRDIKVLGDWNGRNTFRSKTRMRGNALGVVLVQQKVSGVAAGPILAAARVK